MAYILIDFFHIMIYYNQILYIIHILCEREGHDSKMVFFLSSTMVTIYLDYKQDI